MLYVFIFNFFVQALDVCQLGDEVRKKEGKLDSSGLFCCFIDFFRIQLCCSTLFLTGFMNKQKHLNFFLCIYLCSDRKW